MEWMTRITAEFFENSDMGGGSGQRMVGERACVRASPTERTAAAEAGAVPLWPVPDAPPAPRAHVPGRNGRRIPARQSGCHRAWGSGSNALSCLSSGSQSRGPRLVRLSPSHGRRTGTTVRPGALE